MQIDNNLASLLTKLASDQQFAKFAQRQLAEAKDLEDAANRLAKLASRAGLEVNPARLVDCHHALHEHRFADDFRALELDELDKVAGGAADISALQALSIDIPRLNFLFNFEKPET